MTGFLIKTAPGVEPVTVAEFKSHARIDTSAEDALCGSLISAARSWAENYTRRAFVAQTWRLTLDAWPVDSIVELPRPPLVSVTSITVYDDCDNPTVCNASSYFLDTMREPGRIALRFGSSWPLPERVVGGIVIDYVAGYGVAANSVPEGIKLAVKQLAAHWYEHRGEAVIMSSSRHDAVANQAGVNVPLVIQALLDPYVIRSVRV